MAASPTASPSDGIRRAAMFAAGASLLAGVLALLVNQQLLAAFFGVSGAAIASWIAVRAPEVLSGRPLTSSTSLTAPELDQATPLLEALPDPALLVDAAGRIAGSNAASRRKLQFESQGLRLSSILRHPGLLDAVQAAAIDGASRTVDYEPTGSVEEHFRVYVAPVTIGRERAALVVFHDQTTMINTERMRVDFLANASHELRTPLASLTLLIETLSGHAKTDPEAQERFLALMHVQADRMRRLIDDLLSLSKIELNEHVPPADEVDLVSLAKEAADALAPIARERKVKLVVKAHHPKAPVVGDRFQLMQVAQNLVDNATKYSPEGGVVEIEAGLGDTREEASALAGKRWDEAGRISLLFPPPTAGRRYSYLRVTDSGPGIARRHLPRLSERFYRVERDETSDHSGTGLGLAIVKHIVNRHRGGFVVESLPGKGSAFAIYVERPPEAANQM